MRKLAAIMFTDIEGYTSKMQLNETLAIQLLDQYKKHIQHELRNHEGRLIKYMGDGSLSVFPSSVMAVRCAIRLQQEFLKGSGIPVRIGIHLGEVIIENKDVFGDAVNLSSRIQSEGTSGAVIISEKVKDELNNHPEISTKLLGSFNLKNVEQPAKLYAVISAGIVVPDAIPLKKSMGAGNIAGHLYNKPLKETTIPGKQKKWRIPLLVALFITILFTIVLIKNKYRPGNFENLRTVAVLPFTNIGPDGVNNYLAEALTEEIISLLSANLKLRIKKIPFDVVKTKGESQLSGLLRNIDAGSVLEGKVQRYGDSLKIFVVLKNIATNDVLWAKPYYKKANEQLLFQQQLAQEISDALQTSFSAEEIMKITKRGTTNPDAYTWYIQGRYAQNKRTIVAMKEAIFLFSKALGEDSSYALAYSGISDNYAILIDNGRIPYDSGYSLAQKALMKSFQLDSTLAEVRASRAIFLSSLEGRRREALRELELALKLSPNYASAHQWYAIELAAEARFDDALQHINKALELEPFSERIWYLKGSILALAKRYPEVIQLQDTLIKKFNDSSKYMALKTECYYRLGKTDSAILSAKYIRPGIKDFVFWNAVIEKNRDALKEQLAQLSPVADNETQAIYLVFMGEKELAIKKLEEAFQKKEFNWLKFLQVAPDWDPLRTEPQFTALLQKMNFN